MNINIESPSALRRKVTIAVEPDEIRRELDKAYNELRRGVVMRGFRPGRAPRNLLERFFGDQVRTDVAQRLVKEYTDRALEENNLKPIVEPEIVTEESKLPETLKFSAVFDLRPEVVVKDYQNLSVPQEKIEVTDKDIDDTVQNLRERQARLKKVEGRTIVDTGDVVVASVEGFEDGKPVPDSKFETRLMEVSPKSLAHGLEEVLTGAEIGQEVRKTRTYPVEYTEKDLAGKTVEWRATVKDIYSKELPVVDDDFAKDQGDCQNLADLRDKIGAELKRHRQAEADARIKQGLLDIVLERNPLEIPESLTTRERRAMESELANTLRSAGIPEEQIAERIKENEEEFAKRASKRAHSALILEAIAGQESIAATDDELAERIGALVRSAGGRNRERVQDFYSHEENREALRTSIRREKALDLLFERATGSTQQPEAR